MFCKNLPRIYVLSKFNSDSMVFFLSNKGFASGGYFCGVQKTKLSQPSIASFILYSVTSANGTHFWNPVHLLQKYLLLDAQTLWSAISTPKRAHYPHSLASPHTDSIQTSVWTPVLSHP